MVKRFNIKIYGLVQGVFFRVTAQEQAEKLELVGFAENKPDGSVYIETEGEEKNLNQFVKWCNIGPTMARVEKVITTEGDIKNFSKFEVY